MKQLFTDFMYFAFVDFLGNLSEVFILISLISLVLGATQFASKSFKWGIIGFMISLVARYGFIQT